jgi:hypothetical protein
MAKMTATEGDFEVMSENLPTQRILINGYYSQK